MIAYTVLDESKAKLTVLDLMKIDHSAEWQGWSENQFLANLPLKWELSLVAKLDERVIGFLLASKKDAGAHIHRFVVSKEERGHGVGSNLLKHFHKLLATRNDIRPIITLKVECLNEDAIRFYKANGFRTRLPYHDNSDHINLWQPVRGRGSNLTYGVHQPNYLPWQGFLSKIIACDVFVILDDVQMPQGRSYVSRTRIRKGDDEQWLTVPVSKGTIPINEIKIADSTFYEKHRSLLNDRYRHWPFFKTVMNVIQDVYSKNYEYLWQLNLNLILSICSYIGIDRVFELSGPMDISETSDERIIKIGEKIGAFSYLSGVGGMNYQSTSKFSDAEISLSLLKVLEISNHTFDTDIPRFGYSIIEILFALNSERISEILHSSMIIEHMNHQ